MRRIKIPNPVVVETYRSFLDTDYASGTALTVRNNASFAANDLILVGNPREEQSEIKQVSSVSGGTTINLSSALTFAHPKGTPIYKILWNFVSIERRTTSGGAFSEISQSGLQYDNPQNLTIYYDSAATDNYGYRYRFYNSVTVTYSEYSPTLNASAPSRQSVRYMVAIVRKLLNDEETKIISTDEIIRSFNRAQDIIYTHNPKFWFLYVDTYELGSGTISATANEDVYTLNNLTAFGHLDTLRYRYNSGSDDVIYQLRRLTAVEFDRIDSDQNQGDDNWPRFYKLLPADASSDNGYFKVTPDIKDSSVGTFIPNYYQKMANLDTVDDLTQVPLPDLLIDYAVGHGYRLAGNEVKAKAYQQGLVNFSDNPKAVPPALEMLDQMDTNQKQAVGQPRSLWRFKGQKAASKLYGEDQPRSADYYRENYF